MKITVAALALALALAACGGVGVGDLTEPGQICPTGTTTLGVDVSHWDGTVDWSKMANDQVAFAFMKATEGLTFVDPQFAANWANAPTAGVIRGAYHYFHPSDDPVMQADFFVATAGIPGPGDLPLTIDLETIDTDTAAEAATSTLAFLARLEELTGQTPIVYTSARVFNTILLTPAGFGGYTLWDVDYVNPCPNVPTPTWSNWTFWQSGDTGTQGGLTMVDVDHFNGSIDQLKAFTVQPVVDAATTRPDLTAPAADLSSTPDLAMGGGKQPGNCACDLGGAGRPSLPSMSGLWLLLLLLLLAISRRVLSAYRR